MGVDPQSDKKKGFFLSGIVVNIKLIKKQKLKNCPLFVLFEKCRPKNEIVTRMNKDMQTTQILLML